MFSLSLVMKEFFSKVIQIDSKTAFQVANGLLLFYIIEVISKVIQKMAFDAIRKEL